MAKFFFITKIFSFCKKSFWAKTIFGLQIFVGLLIVLDPNIFDLELFGTNTFLDPQFFVLWTQIFFRPRIFSGLKSFLDQTILFTLYLFWTQNIFGVNLFWNKLFLDTRHFWPISFWNAIWTQIFFNPKFLGQKRKWEPGSNST